MQSIPQVQNYPDQTPIDAIQITVSGVYERRTDVGQYKTSVQNADGVDVAGNKIRLDVWGHPDLTPLKGKEIVLHSVNGKGVKVKHSSYFSKKENKEVKQVGLEVSKAGQFQVVEVYHQQAGSEMPVKAVSSPSEAIQTRGDTNLPVQAQNPVKGQERANPGIFGATVGMSLNNAVHALTAVGQPLDEDNVWKLASKLIRVSQRLERGDLYQEKADV